MDFLDILLSARDDEGQGLNDSEIRQEVDTFLFEGEHCENTTKRKKSNKVIENTIRILLINISNSYRVNNIVKKKLVYDCTTKPRKFFIFPIVNNEQFITN